MKRKLLIGLLGLSLTTSSFAYELLWSKEKVTGGGQGHIEREVTSSNSKSNTCSVNGYNFDVKKNLARVIFTDHYTSANNYFETRHRYKIYYKLGTLGQAYEWWGEIELRPHEVYNEHARSQLTTQSGQVGNFDIQNVTEMTGDNNSKDEKHSKLHVTR